MKGIAVFEVYQKPGKQKQKWYNRLRAPNGRIIQDGAEGYSNKEDAGKAYKWFDASKVRFVETV